MRPCFLHVGLHKTGTSSIQASLRGYDDGTTAYARLEDPNHSIALRGVFGPRIDAEAERRAAWSAELDADLDRADRALILSGEGLSRPSADDQIPDRLLARIAQSGRPVRILAYVRAPGAMMASLLQQLAKTGGFLSDARAYWPDYRRRLEKWDRAAPGVERVFAPFGRPHLRQGCVVRDFAGRIGLEPARLQVLNRNESLCGDAVALLFALARYRGSEMQAMSDRARRRMIRRLAAMQGARVAFAPDIVHRVAGEQADDLAWMAARLSLPPEEGRAFLDPSAEPAAPGTLHIAAPGDLEGMAGRRLEELRSWQPHYRPNGDSDDERAADCLLWFMRRLTAREALPG